MRSGAILLVECDHCHLVIEAPLQRTVSGQWDSSPYRIGIVVVARRLQRTVSGQWDSSGVNGYLARQGWVSDADGNDYCSAACRRAATEGRREGESWSTSNKSSAD